MSDAKKKGDEKELKLVFLPNHPYHPLLLGHSLNKSDICNVCGQECAVPLHQQLHCNVKFCNFTMCTSCADECRRLTSAQKIQEHASLCAKLWPVSSSPTFATASESTALSSSPTLATASESKGDDSCSARYAV